MKCPLFAISSKEQVRRGFLTHIDCLKEECAWWNKTFGMCSQAVGAYLKGIAVRRREAMND